jgi:hypothetical protein
MLEELTHCELIGLRDLLGRQRLLQGASGEIIREFFRHPVFERSRKQPFSLSFLSVGKPFRLPSN